MLHFNVLIIPSSALHRLSDENLHGTSGSAVNLIVHHVLEPLIVRWAKKNLSIDLATGVSVEHDLVSTQLVAVLHQQSRDLLDVNGIVERCRVADLTLVGRHLALDTLDQMADSHA